MSSSWLLTTEEILCILNLRHIKRCAVCCSQLSYVGQDCWKIPPVLGQMYGARARFLDLSFNSLTTLQGVEKFSDLEELVLDNNRLCDSILVPRLPNLQILSLNKNNVSLVNIACCELISVSLYLKLLLLFYNIYYHVPFQFLKVLLLVCFHLVYSHGRCFSNIVGSKLWTTKIGWSVLNVIKVSQH
jgi:hypothetical protein